MKSLNIILAAAVLAGAMTLSSCGKKGLLKPDDKKGKHECSHNNNDGNSETTSESGT
ncbi:MAG: hypothetical protein V4580_05230 [Bacteroidota bacterium]